MPEEIKSSVDLFSLNLGDTNAAIIQKTLNMTDPGPHGQASTYLGQCNTYQGQAITGELMNQLTYTVYQNLFST